MVTITKFKAGIYDADYNFEDLTDGATTIDGSWSLAAPGDCTLAVASSFNGHAKILKGYDPINTCYCQASYDFGAQEDSGTVEFWICTTDVTKSTAIYLKDIDNDKYIAGIHIDSSKFQYLSGAIGWTDIPAAPTPVNEQWYRISIRWESTAGAYQGLAEDDYKLFIDGTEYGDFNFPEAGSPSRFFCATNQADMTYTYYFDAFGIADTGGSYTIGDNASLSSSTTISNSNVVSMKIHHPTSLIPTDVKFGNDTYQKYFPICVAEIKSTELISLGEIIQITDTHTSAGASASEVCFKGMVMRKLIEPYTDFLPKYLIFSNSREKDDVFPEGSYTVDTDGYIADIITNDCSLISNGGLTDGDDLGTFTAGGEKSFTRIIQTCCRLDGYIAYDDPATGANNADLVYDDGSVDTGVNIDESTSSMGLLGVENIDEHINYLLVRGGIKADGTRAESTPAEDSDSQALYGVRKYYDTDSNLITDAACTAKAATILSANQYGRLKVKLFYKNATYGFLQPGENITFDWDSTVHDIGFNIEQDQYIIAHNVYDVKTQGNTMIIMSGIYYAPLQTDDIVQEQGQLIAQNTDNITSCQNDDHYILLQDQVAQGTQGGTFTTGAWRTRNISTEVEDTGNHCTLSSNQFTLDAGTYYIRAKAPAYAVSSHWLRLYNISDSSEVLVGLNETANNANLVSNVAGLEGRFTIAASKTFELQHQCTTTVANFGLGVAKNVAGYVEKYAQVELWKVG